MNYEKYISGTVFREPGPRLNHDMDNRGAVLWSFQNKHTAMYIRYAPVQFSSITSIKVRY